MTRPSERFANGIPALLLSVLLLAGLTLQATANPAQWKRGGFTTDFTKAIVSFEEIFSGGPPKDGIPSIDAPQFISAADATWLEDNEPVILLTRDGTAKAYPLQILIWHEIVNDIIGGMPVAVTYCPLCNSSIVFDRRFEGEVLDFGTTGLLRKSDLVMYDRQSESWWQQFTGEGIVGTHAGRELKMLPSRVTSFADFRARHPDGQVLDRPNGPRRDYGRNPYIGYDSRQAPYPLYQGTLPDNINPMDRVVVVTDGQERYAARLAHVREREALDLSDTVTLRWTGENASILDTRLTKTGRPIAAVEAVKTDGSKQELLVHDVTFAFVVHAFYPDLPILGITAP